MFEIRVLQGGVQEKAHSHQNYEIFLVLSGRADIYNGEDCYKLNKDDMFFMNSNVKHRSIVHSDSILLSFSISYSEAYKIIALPYLIFNLEPKPERVSDLALLRRQLKNIIKLSIRGSTIDNIQLYGLYSEVLLTLVTKFSSWEANQTDNNEKGKADRFLYIQNYIINNYSKQISLQDLSDQFGLSVPYLSKYLKREMGMGFVEFLNNIRVHHAAENLVETNKPITQIAYDNGFTNLTSFNRLFKSTFHSSPSEYRKSNLRQIEEASEQKLGAAKELLAEHLIKNPFTLIKDEGMETIRGNIRVSEGSKRNYGIWNNVIAFGPSYRLMDFKVQAHVLELCEGVGCNTIRVWGLFSKENAINRDERKKYNFTRLNNIFDFLYNNGLVPCVDFGTQAEEIYGAFGKILHHKDSDYDFPDLDQYKLLVTQFLRDAINRYGIEYVSRWKFDIWRDPRIGLENEEVTFFRVYDLIYDVIKGILPNAEIGGCGTAIVGSTAEFEKILSIWAKRNVKPDFFSVALYPYTKTPTGPALSPDGDYFLRNADKLKSLMAAYGFADKKIYANEWNLTRSNRNSINDSCYKAAYIVRNSIVCMGHIDGMAYNGTTDLLVEEYDTIGELSGGSGLITKDGIKKPAFYAFNFLSRLGDELICTAENYIVTKKYDDIIILCHNCQQPGLDYYYHYKDEIKPAEVDELFEKKPLQILFSLSDMKGGEYIVKKYCINGESGSILHTWLKSNIQGALDMADVEFFKSMSIPSIYGEAVNTASARIDYRTVLEENEIQLIHFKYQI